MKIARTKWWVAGLLAAALAGCGVPREAAVLAHEAAIAAPASAETQDVRAALLAQQSQWSRLETLAGQQEFGGIWGIDPQFQTLVSRTAALARRQAALIEQGQDDPAKNAAALKQFQILWADADRCLNSR